MSDELKEDCCVIDSTIPDDAIMFKNCGCHPNDFPEPEKIGTFNTVTSAIVFNTEPTF